MSVMKRTLCALLPFVALFALSVQARPVPAKEAKRVIPYTRVVPGQGMIMMRLVTNRDLSNFSTKWDKFDVRELKTGKEYKLKDLYDGGHNATFVASLPPGDYQAERMRVGDAVWQSLAEYGTAEFDAGGWRFKVEAGRMTNLGTLLFLQPYTPLVNPAANAGGGYRSRMVFSWVHTPDETLPQRSAYLFHPDDYPAVLSKSLGWTTVPANAQASLLPRYKRLTLALAGGAAASDGGMLFGEHYGQIGWRHPDGRWTWEDTGTLESILFAADAADGTRYAAAEGSVLLRREKSGEWRRIPVALEDATPRILHAYADGSLLTIWAQLDRFTALRYRPGADPEWTPVWELPAPKGKIAKTIGYCNAVFTSRAIAFSTETAGLFKVKTKALAVLDLSTDQWSHSDPDIDGPVSIMPDGSLFSMTGGQSNQIFKVAKVSTQPWEVRSTGTNTLRQPQFRTADEGYTISSYAYWSNVPSMLFRTSDGGRSWQQVVQLPSGTNWFRVLPGQEMLIATEEGKFYSSRDNGQRWRLERDANAGT
jgi:hypothetical protein